MQIVSLAAGRRLTGWLVAGFTVASLSGHAVLAQEVGAPPVFGCSWATPPPEQAASGAAPAGNEAEPGVPIVGSIPAPPNADEDNQALLKPLASIQRAQAIQRASAVIPDLPRRRVAEARLQIEQGYVVWDVEFGYRRGEQGTDPSIEVVVDAGTGQVLLIECEDEDDD